MVPRDVLIRTAFNGFSIMFLGIQLSQRGPAFIDLIDISGTGVEGGSVYITCGNVCYMLGSFISGYLYSRVKVTSLTQAVSLILGGLLVGATPWCSQFVSMLLVISMLNVFIGLVDATTSTEQMRICKGDSAWATQWLSFTYSLGGILGPLVTEPFLAPNETVNTTDHDVSSNYTRTPSSGDLDVFPNASGKNFTLTLNQRPDSGIEMSNKSDPDSIEYSIRYAFLIAAVLGVLASIPYFVQAFRSRSKEHKKEEPSIMTPSSRELPTKAYLIVVVTASIYYFLFSAFEDALIQYLSYFVVNHLDWQKQNGALVTAVYWIFSTFVKFALIFLASRINSETILLVSNIGMVVSSLGFAVVSQLQVHSMVWVFTAINGLSASALFGGGMAWVDSTLLQMDGKATASLLFSSGLGSTVLPIPIGTLMKNWTTMAFAYLVFGVSCLDAIIIILLLFIIKPQIHRKYGPPRPNTEVEVSLQDECTDMNNGGLVPRLPLHEEQS